MEDPDRIRKDTKGLREHLTREHITTDMMQMLQPLGRDFVPPLHPFPIPNKEEQVDAGSNENEERQIGKLVVDYKSLAKAFVGEHQLAQKRACKSVAKSIVADHQLPQQCTICKKRFARRVTLMAHLFSHQS